MASSQLTNSSGSAHFGMAEGKLKQKGSGRRRQQTNPKLNTSAPHLLWSFIVDMTNVSQPPRQTRSRSTSSEKKSCSVRGLAEHSWSEENLRAVVEKPQKPKTWTSHLQLNLSLFLMHHKKYPKMRRRSPQQNQGKTKKCRESH